MLQVRGGREGTPAKHENLWKCWKIWYLSKFTILHRHPVRFRSLFATFLIVFECSSILNPFSVFLVLWPYFSYLRKLRQRPKEIYSPTNYLTVTNAKFCYYLHFSAKCPKILQILRFSSNVAKYSFNNWNSFGVPITRTSKMRSKVRSETRKWSVRGTSRYNADCLRSASIKGEAKFDNLSRYCHMTSMNDCLLCTGVHVAAVVQLLITMQ